jgi:hypothetical protein
VVLADPLPGAQVQPKIRVIHDLGAQSVTAREDVENGQEQERVKKVEGGRRAGFQVIHRVAIVLEDVSMREREQALSLFCIFSERAI